MKKIRSWSAPRLTAVIAALTLTGVAIGVADTDYVNAALGAAQMAAGLINQRFGRNAERESDYYGTRMIAIEVKAATRFRSEFTNGIRSLRETHPDSQGYVVYRGSEELLVEDVRVLPVEVFLRRLHAGEVLV